MSRAWLDLGDAPEDAGGHIGPIENEEGDGRL